MSALAMLLIATECSVFGPALDALVTSAQRAAITRYYLTRQWVPDGFPKVGCSVDVLGAAQLGRRLRVYTVIHCLSATRQCTGMTDYTAGLVADLAGTTLVRAQLDDADDYDGMIAEASIYPDPLRSVALNYINVDGPGWLRTLAAKAAGCPDGLRQFVP